MELYTVEGYLTDLPTKDGFSYMDFYLRKNNYLTYDGGVLQAYQFWKQAQSLGKMVPPALMVNGKPSSLQLFKLSIVEFWDWASLLLF